MQGGGGCLRFPCPFSYGGGGAHDGNARQRACGQRHDDDAGLWPVTRQAVWAVRAAREASRRRDCCRRPIGPHKGAHAWRLAQWPMARRGRRTVPPWSDSDTRWRMVQWPMAQRGRHTVLPWSDNDNRWGIAGLERRAADGVILPILPFFPTGLIYTMNSNLNTEPD